MRKIIISISVFILIMIIAVISLNYYFKNKIEAFLASDLPPNVNLTYNNINVETLRGNISMKGVTLILSNNPDSLPHTTLTIDKLSLIDADYWDYLVNNTIHFRSIEIKNNAITHRKYKKKDSTQKSSSESPALSKSILIDNFKVEKTEITILDGSNDSTLLRTPNISFAISRLSTNKNLISSKIPFKYGAINLKADSLFYRLNAYDNLNIKNINLTKDHLAIIQISIKTQYTKSQLSQIIPYERDHTNLTIPKIVFENLDFGSLNNKVFLKSSQINIENPIFNIYRDKLVADDTTNKPLYSKMLRDLSFDLMIDRVTINDASLEYSERVKKDQEAGKISFNKLNCSITNFSNTYALGEKTTNIDINALFMKKSPITVNWSFDVQNKEDEFRFKGELTQLPVVALNSFTQPNLNVELSGDVQKDYFDISGNQTNSLIKMNMDYDDFKIAVINDKKNKKNWVLSTIANLFVSNDSNDQNNESFRKGEGKAERDKTKSFFNYLWLNIKQGLVAVMVGDGKIH
ncbi:MAG: hypothetical protein V7767_05925 [Leeuwenhoekiella sp.]